MKIIFLDIDGVLNVYCESRDQYGCTFHQHFVDNLKYIIDNTGAKIVLSSTWRMSGLDVIRAMWRDRNLPGEVIDITPFIIDPSELDDYFMLEREHYPDRGYEIQQWLNDNKDLNITNYCIIDDDQDMLDEQLRYFVKTSDNIEHLDCIDIGYGLTKQCAEQCIKILNNEI